MKIHFIGIGGIGVSALAQYYLAKGHKISGSDLVCSEITQALKKKRAKILIGKHKKENLPQNTDLLIYSPAVKKENPELKAAKKKEIECQSYPQALGALTKEHFTIAVCGTHGKSTTTALIGLILAKAGLDPTVIVGTKLKEFKNSTHPTSSGLTLGYYSGSNCRTGKSQYLVIEADEHFASFLNYWPKIIILTALEPDHLDYYKNFKNYLLAFKKFISHLPEKGVLIANKDDKNISKAFSKAAKKTFWYSLKDKESQKLKKILKVPGEFNVSNALAALNAARTLKISDKKSFQALSGYKGSWRRFEKHKLTVQKKSITIINDYGHHPTEVRVTLKAAREKYPDKKICCLFQPHQYQRTYYLFDDFVKVFGQSLIDLIIITDIYDVAGREEKKIKKKVSSEKMVKAVNKENVIYLAKDKILDYLKKKIANFDIAIFMGAGNIYDLTKGLDKILE